MPQAIEPPIRSKCIVLGRLQPVWGAFSLEVAVYNGLVGCNSHFVPCGSFVEFPAAWSKSDNPHVLGRKLQCVQCLPPTLMATMVQIMTSRKNSLMLLLTTSNQPYIW